MSVRKHTQLVREGEFVAEVEVELTGEDRSWGPYLSVADAARLDDIRAALRAGDLIRAAELSEHVYRLTPVA